jgi:hypothetical protein
MNYDTHDEIQQEIYASKYQFHSMDYGFDEKTSLAIEEKKKNKENQ